MERETIVLRKAFRVSHPPDLPLLKQSPPTWTQRPWRAPMASNAGGLDAEVGESFLGSSRSFSGAYTCGGGGVAPRKR